MENKFTPQLDDLAGMIASKLKLGFEEIMNIDELSEYIKLDRQTIYALTSNREIPFCKPTGKLLFLKSEILQWLRDSRVDTITEMEMKAMQK